MRAKQPKDYYLDGLTAVFQPGVSVPGPLRVDQKFSGAEVALLNPGPSVVEVLGIVNRFPDLKCLHLVESNEANLAVIRSGLQKEVGRRWLPELAGYVTDIRKLPAELARRCELVVEINVVDPKADKLFRQDAAQQISRVLKLGGLFYSAGVTVRWTDGVIPLSLVRVRVRARMLKRAGYSDALPRPVLYLKRAPDEPIVMTDEGKLWRWWRQVSVVPRSRTDEGWRSDRDAMRAARRRWTRRAQPDAMAFSHHQAGDPAPGDGLDPQGRRPFWKSDAGSAVAT